MTLSKLLVELKGQAESFNLETGAGADVAASAPKKKAFNYFDNQDDSLSESNSDGSSSSSEEVVVINYKKIPQHL